jgi:hypothetical protein
MADRFIKFIPSEEAMWLLKNRGHAFRLLTIIAESARREDGHSDGLKPGEAFIGGFENYDMTEQNYRSAKKILTERGHIEIKETCRTRKKQVTTENKSANTKVTTEVTTVSTKVKLLSSTVYNVNLFIDNDRSNERVTTENKKGNDKQDRKNERKKEYKKESIQSIEVAQPMLDLRSILLYEKKEEQIECFRRYSAEKCIEFTLKDIRGWFKVYEADYIVSIYELLLKEIDLVRTNKDKDPIRNPAAWMQKALDKNFIAANMLAAYNRDYALHMQKNGWPNLKILTRYACDNTTGKDFIFSDPNCKIIMEREYERVMGG